MCVNLMIKGEVIIFEIYWYIYVVIYLLINFNLDCFYDYKIMIIWLI